MVNVLTKITLILFVLIVVFIILWVILGKNRAVSWPQNYTPSIYFINLDRSEDRWMNIKNQVKKLNITNYNRYSGIDGKIYKLNNFEKNLFKNANFDCETNKGTSGCALSHLYLWKRMIDNNIKDCIVFEDDIIFNKNIKKQLEEVYSIKKDYDVVYLTNTLGNNNYWGSSNEIIPYTKLWWFGGGARGYYINNNGARHLVKSAFTTGINNAIDWFMYNHYNTMKIGIIKYPLVKHNENLQSVRIKDNKR